MARDTFRDYAFSDDLTHVSDSLWRQLRGLMRKRIQRERKKHNIAGTDPAAGWDLIMDDNRHVVNPPRPKDTPDSITPAELSSVVNHIARAERVFEIYNSSQEHDRSLLDDVKHDVEAAVLGVAAWNDEDYNLAWEALNLLGRTGEIDIVLSYEAVLFTAFDTSDSMVDHPSPEELANRLISRMEPVALPLADNIRTVWATYLMMHGKRKDGEKIYNQLIKKTPDDPRFHASLALALRSVGDKPQAVKTLNKALELAIKQEQQDVAELVALQLVELGAMTEEEAEELLDEEFGDDLFSDELEEDEEDALIDDEFIEEAMADHPEYAAFIDKHGPGVEMDGMSPMMHIVMHSVVEKQLRSGEIPEMRMVLLKLTSQGMSRHDAIHRLAEPLAETLFDILSGQKEFDKEAYTRKIRKLLR